MNRIFIPILACVLSVSIFTACKEKTNNKNTTETEKSSGLKVAVIDIDSMQSVLDFFKTKSAEFAKEQEAIQNELIGIQRSIQNTAANLQKRIQNKDISDVEVQSISKKIEGMQASLQKKQENLGGSLMKKQSEFSMTLTAMMEAFTKEYNSTAKYDLILIKSVAVFHQPAMNITADFTPKFNDWINKKLKDEAVMKSFAKQGEDKAKEKENAINDTPTVK